MSKQDESDAGTKAAAADMQQAGLKAFGRITKSFLGTWRLYRQSKTGLLGLGIVIAFLVVAAFAPWLAPYDKDFKAPAIDVFIADYVTRDLPTELNWTSMMGLTSAQRDHPLERLMVYSPSGYSQVYPVAEGIGEETGQIGIVVGTPSMFTVPADATYMSYVHFSTSFFFFLNSTDGSGTTLYEYDNGFGYVREYDIPFLPKYESNLWNGFSFVVQTARMAIAFADDHNVWLLDKRPPTVFEPGIDAVNFVDNLTISNATVIGNPVIVDGEFDNGSMLFVPTDAGIWAYKLNITKHPITMRVLDVSIGDMVWTADYVAENETFEPVAGNRMLTFQYPYAPTTEIGKEYLALASTDGRVVAYERETGNVTWSNKIILAGVRDFEIKAVHPSPDYVIITGQTDERGLIAGLIPETGKVAYNNSMYAEVDSYLNSDPQYVAGQLRYVFSTEKGTIYLVTELLKVNATFSAPGGGSATPVKYLGNIYIEMSKTGNYFGVITQAGSMFVETLTGVNIAPLPPGTYPSGNYYPLGTDYEGHDILTQVMFGTQAELLVGITAAFFSVVIGTIVGLVAGFYGGLVDDLLMRSTDVMLSLPYLVIMLLFAAAFGPSLLNIIIIFAILSWAGIARVIRSVTLSIKSRAFVDAARVSGASDSRLIFRHIGPNVLPFTFLYMTFNISGAIVTEAILAFLGFGDPTNVTWGMMLQYLQISGHSLDAPWWLLPPGIAITLLSLAFYLIGRAFDEVVNPRLRKR